MQIRHNVNVLFHSIDAVRHALLIPDDAADVFMQFILVCFGKRWPAIFRAEYNVIKNLAVSTHA